ncbi:DUF29 domain-containing protein [Methylobacterium sp. J-072]|uniref:DUF29 family protein n=1 Tax=Methylobacterium sp. J-072 TaxID=2836651 RepID=UPI001FBBE346|nr:DUF29 family protein [Methylobacterium sp. J-072]MCJ2093519.1 DUF29 domain-containing protein [Methylobacterium sp. J-072]
MAKAALKTPPRDDLYETDFFLWTQAQADLLRARRLDELDLDHLIDQVANVGAIDQREIRNRLTVWISPFSPSSLRSPSKTRCPTASCRRSLI